MSDEKSISFNEQGYLIWNHFIRKSRKDQGSKLGQGPSANSGITSHKVTGNYTNVDFVSKVMKKEKILEWTGVITAIVYSLLVAMNIGAEFLGFTLLLISAILIGLWAFIGKHKGILLLQLFYASAGIIGMLRWF